MSSAMNPARPVYKMKSIANLTGYQNGRLDDRVLAKTTARQLKMNGVSARKFNALQGEAIRNGIALTSSGDYRTFASQLNGLLVRYDLGYFPGRADYNTYDGQVYSLKEGATQVATPGLSQHGWGRARDFAVMIGGHVLPIRPADAKWLATYAPKFGIYFPVVSEDWHGEDFAGDDFSLCRAVTDYEKGDLGVPIPPFTPAQGLFSLYPFDTHKATIRLVTPNMHSDLVAYMQGVFKVRLGYAIKVDGWYGGQTDAFVRFFQTFYKLKVDGIVGPITWAKIDSLS